MKSAPKCLLLFYNLLNINILPPPAYKQRNSYFGSVAFGATEMLYGCFGVRSKHGGDMRMSMQKIMCLIIFYENTKLCEAFKYY